MNKANPETVMLRSSSLVRAFHSSLMESAYSLARLAWLCGSSSNVVVHFSDSCRRPYSQSLLPENWGISENAKRVSFSNSDSLSELRSILSLLPEGVVLVKAWLTLVTKGFVFAAMADSFWFRTSALDLGISPHVPPKKFKSLFNGPRAGTHGNFVSYLALSRPTSLGFTIYLTTQLPPSLSIILNTSRGVNFLGFMIPLWGCLIAQEFSAAPIAILWHKVMSQIYQLIKMHTTPKSLYWFRLV